MESNTIVAYAKIPVDTSLFYKLKVFTDAADVDTYIMDRLSKVRRRA